jgi:hypothetical protein
MTDEQKLSFDFARSVTVQLITVAAAIITLGVTFFEKFRPAVGTPKWGACLIASWAALTLSIVGGFWSWLAQTGTLAKPGILGFTIYRPNIMLPAIVQIVAFIAGLILTIVYGSHAVP